MKAFVTVKSGSQGDYVKQSWHVTMTCIHATIMAIVITISAGVVSITMERGVKYIVSSIPFLKKLFEIILTIGQKRSS